MTIYWTQGPGRSHGLISTGKIRFIGMKTYLNEILSAGYGRGRLYYRMIEK